MKRASIEFLMALGVSAAIGPSAYAATEILQLPGASCNPQKADVGKVSYTSQFGAQNDSTTSTARVFCPLVAQFAGPFDVNLFVRDRSATADVSCTLTMTTPNLATIVFTSTKTSTGSSTFPQELHFSPPNITGGWIGSIACTLPINPGSSSSSVVAFGISYQPN